jgi:dienelactone hydrolase
MRILCFHGYRSSAAVQRRAIAPLAQALRSAPEFVCVDAPSLARGDFGWWTEGFAGWEESRDWVAGLLAGEEFDGVFGFSQGAALAGLLCAALATPPGFAIMAGGFTSPFERHAYLFTRKLRVPSAHIIGKADTVITPADSLLLADRFEQPLVIEHAGGHVIPSGATVVVQLDDFLNRVKEAR